MRTLLAATGIILAAITVGVATYASQADDRSPPPTTSLTVDDTTGLLDRDDPVQTGHDNVVQDGTTMPSPATSPPPNASPSCEDDDGLLHRDDGDEPGDDHDSDTNGEGYKHDDDGWDDADHDD